MGIDKIMGVMFEVLATLGVCVSVRTSSLKVMNPNHIARRHERDYSSKTRRINTYTYIQIVHTNIS